MFTKSFLALLPVLFTVPALAGEDTVLLLTNDATAVVQLFPHLLVSSTASTRATVVSANQSERTTMFGLGQAVMITQMKLGNGFTLNFESTGSKGWGTLLTPAGQTYVSFDSCTAEYRY